jgi:hypothetical protein
MTLQKGPAGRGPIVAKAMMDERPALPFWGCAAANAHLFPNNQ